MIFVQLKQIQATSTLKPQFDRDGREIRGVGYWLGLLFTLGSDDMKSTVMRWAVLVAVAVGAKRYVEKNGLPSHLR
jgi:beta-apo-4'-carotenal oxygenase